MCIQFALAPFTSLSPLATVSRRDRLQHYIGPQQRRYRACDLILQPMSNQE